MSSEWAAPGYRDVVVRAASTRHALVLSLLLVGVGAAHAELIPTFPVTQEARGSTHVVIARKDGARGAIVVLESLKGDLAPGERITVPFLAVFDDPQERKVIYPTWAEERGVVLDGDRMYIFLTRTTSGEWRPCTPWHDDRPSFVWVEKGRVFGHQRGNGYVTPIPGAVRVEYIDRLRGPGPTDETTLRRSIESTIAATASLTLVKAIPDRAKRAEALFELLEDDPNDPVLDALASCGEDAVPFLDRLLADEARAEVHFAAVQALRVMDTRSIDPVLVRVIERETAYLESVLGRPVRERERLGEHESTIQAALQTLLVRRPAGCREQVRRLRDRLAKVARPGSPRLTAECERVLEVLGE